LSSLPATTKTRNVDKWKISIPTRFVFEIIYWIHYKGTNHAGRDLLIAKATNYWEYWGLDIDLNGSKNIQIKYILEGF